MLADEEEPGSGEVDVGCLRVPCVGRGRPIVGRAVCVILCGCWVCCVVLRVFVRDVEFGGVIWFVEGGLRFFDLCERGSGAC